MRLSSRDLETNRECLALCLQVLQTSFHPYSDILVDHVAVANFKFGPGPASPRFWDVLWQRSHQQVANQKFSPVRAQLLPHVKHMLIAGTTPRQCN